MREGINPHEEGAAATMSLFAITLFLLAVTMLAIDAGSIWVSRRGQIADADSAAHATALLLVGAPCATQSLINAAADELISANGAVTTRDGDVTVTYANDDCLSNAGTATVATTTPANLYFAPLFGFDSAETGASTTVAFGQVNTLQRLRPIGICGVDPHYVNEWRPYFSATHSGVDPLVARATYETAIATTDTTYATSLPGFDPHPTTDPDGNAYSGADVVHRLVFQRLAATSAGSGGNNGGGNNGGGNNGGGNDGGNGGGGSAGGSDCPGASGNFGWLDFDDGGGGNNQLVTRIVNGYDGSVTLGSAVDGDEDCDAEDAPLDECPPQTGAHGQATASALDAITCPPAAPASACETLYIVVYSDLSGNGGNARFDLQSFAGIVLRGHQVGTGELGGENFLDIEFVDDLAEGPIAPAAPGSTAPFGTQQCAVDGFDNC